MSPERLPQISRQSRRVSCGSAETAPPPPKPKPLTLGEASGDREMALATVAPSSRRPGNFLSSQNARGLHGRRLTDSRLALGWIHPRKGDDAIVSAPTNRQRRNHLPWVAELPATSRSPSGIEARHRLWLPGTGRAALAVPQSQETGTGLDATLPCEEEVRIHSYIRNGRRGDRQATTSTSQEPSRKQSSICHDLHYLAQGAYVTSVLGQALLRAAYCRSRVYL